MNIQHGQNALATNDIERVLTAERDGDGLIQKAHAEAETLREAARSQARRITNRTEARISALHGRFEAKLSRDVTALHQAASEETRKSPQAVWTSEQIKQAASTIAAVLTGGRDAGESG